MNKEERPKFIQLRKLDETCRCCGHGKEYICDTCYELLHNGYAVLIEMRDDPRPKRKKVTGNAVAILAEKFYEFETQQPITANAIYFIRESDLKQFMGNAYRSSTDRHPATKLLTAAPRPANRQSAGSARSAAELLVA
jgi:hypothetical protein